MVSCAFDGDAVVVPRDDVPDDVQDVPGVQRDVHWARPDWLSYADACRGDRVGDGDKDDAYPDAQGDLVGEPVVLG